MIRVSIALLISLALPSVAIAETRHGLSLAQTGQSVSTDDDRSFSVYSAGVAYGFHWVGDRVGIDLRLEMLLPLGASQRGDGLWALDLYDRIYGVDLTLAATRSFSLGEEIGGFAGAGPHLNLFALDDAVLRDVEHAALGGAAVAGVSQALEQEWLGGQLAVGVRLDLTADPVDLARGGNLAWALGARLSLLAELVYD